MSLFDDTYFILMCFGALLSAAWFLLKHPRLKRYKLPPGPIGFPILGMLPYINRTYPGQSVLKLSKWYGKMFFGYMGSYGTLFLNDYETIKKAMTRADETFSDRPHTAFFEQFGDGGKGVGCCFVDNRWKVQRQFLLRSLRKSGMGKTEGHFNDIIMREVDYLMDAYAKVTGPINPEKLLSMAICNVTCKFTYGKRYAYTDKEFGKFIEDMQQVFHYAAPGDLTSYLPFLRFVPFSGYNDLANCSRRLEAGLFRKEIDEHIQKIELDREPIDMIDAFLKKKEEWPNGISYYNKPGSTYNNLIHIVADTFAGGTDTTASSMLWAIAYVTKYKDHQKQLQEEIDHVVGRDSGPTLKDKPNMRLVQAFLAESMRLGTPGPLGVPHGAWKDTKLNGRDIPKGTVIVANIYGVLHDPDVFPDPESFDPSRFFDDEGKLKTSLLDRTNVQFGVGRRLCPGMELAHMMRFIFFSHLLQRFNLTEPSPGSISLEPTVSISTTPLPFEINLEPR